MLEAKKKTAKQTSAPISKTPEDAIASAKKTSYITTRIRKIGNSKGVLLTNNIIKELGIEDGAEVMITTEKGRIIIESTKSKRKINTVLSTWEAQFKAAIKKGDKPEDDMFEAMKNKFDKEEW